MNVRLEFRRITTAEGQLDVDLTVAESEQVLVLDARKIGQAAQFDVVIIDGQWKDS